MMNPAITFQSNDTLDARDQEEAKLRLVSQPQAVVSSLASYMSTCWEASKQSKAPIELIELRMMRMQRGEYEANVLADIQLRGGSSIFMRLADEKAEAAKAWLIDILLPANEEPWGIKPSPVPTLPPEQESLIKQAVEAKAQSYINSGFFTDMSQIANKVNEAKAEVQKKLREAAREVENAVEEKIKDVVVESNWRDALEAFIGNLVDHKAAFLKGPIFRHKRVIVRRPDGIAEIKVELRMDFEAPDPRNIYPSPSARGINDGYLIEKHTLTRKTISEMRGVPGYNTPAIEQVLQEYGSGGLRRWVYETNQAEFERLSGNTNVDADPEGKIDALQFFGSVQGLKLIEHGIDPSRMPDVFAEYEAEIWMIGRHIIKCVLNENPMGERDYFKASFRQKNNQFWGDSLLELVEDSNRMCNVAARNIANNMGICSGPQVGVDISALPPGEVVETISPMKIWQFHMRNVSNSTRPPIWFFQPKSVVNEFIKVYEFFSNEADNKTGIPKYSYGQGGGGGAINTATGFSMMMSNASRGIKRVVKNIDKVIQGSIQAIHNHLILHSPDPIFKTGDVTLIAKGSATLIAKEQQQLRRTEALQTILHPDVMAVIGPEGLGEFLRTYFTGLDMNTTNEIVPEREEVRQKAMAMGQYTEGALAPPPAQQGAATNQAGDRQGGQDARLF